MGIKITSISEALESNGIKILIHGLAGSGKTVFCATTGVPTLIISAESGLLSIAGAPDYIKTTVVKTIYELEQVYDYVFNNPGLFKFVALDSISEIAEVLLADEKKNSKDPRQAYGNLSDRMLSILRGFRDLPDIDVIMSCKQVSRENSDTGITTFVPSLPGQALTNAIGYLFDEVFALRVEKDEDGHDYRTIQTGRDRNYEAKDRSGVLEMFEAPSARKIIEKIRAAMPDKPTPEEPDEEFFEQQKELDKVVEEKEQTLEDHEHKGKTDAEIETEHLQSTEANKERLEESIQQAKDGDVAEAEEYEKGALARAAEQAEKESEQEAVEEKEVQSEESVEEKGTNIIENETDKVMYLYHNASDAILKLPPNDYIDDDGNIDVIDFKTYVEHSKRLKAADEAKA